MSLIWRKISRSVIPAVAPAMALAAALLLAPSLCRIAAADDLYTVGDVHVDVSAASSAEAFNNAIAQGRPKAWTVLYRRLTQQKDWPRQPNLDPAALLRLSRGYTVAHELRSTTRYVADVTYVFNPDAVARTLQSAGIPFTQGTAKRILIVPMSPGFQSGPWAAALSAPGLRDSVVPFGVAGPADAASLNGIDFDNANWGDVSTAAHRIGASEVALVQAVYANGKVTVNIRRLGIGETPARTSVDVPLLQTVGTTYPAAAQAAIAAIQDMWKSRTAIDLSQRGRLTATVRVASLAQWGQIQSALAAADDVTGVTVNAMDIGYAQIAIAYQGTTDQLRDTLGGSGLTLTPVRGGDWTLAMNGGSP